MTSDWREVRKDLIGAPFETKQWDKLILLTNQRFEGINCRDQLTLKDLYRNTLRAYLLLQPWLSKYWVSLAKWEYKSGNKSKAEETFKEALKYVSYDVQFWIAYLEFEIESFDCEVSELLELFEEARFHIGLNFHSLQFYHMYLSFLNRYATARNGFWEKSNLLLRHILEIPAYEVAQIYNTKLYKILQGPSYSAVINSVAPAEGTSTQFEGRKNIDYFRKTSLETFRGLALAIQYDTFEIYHYERSLSKYLQHGQMPTCEDDMFNWSLYLEYAENFLPFSYVRQLYERLMLLAQTTYDIENRYFQFMLSTGRLNCAKNLLNRFLSRGSSINNFRHMVTLVDLELNAHNFARARDLVIDFVELNEDIPLEILVKLLQVEAAINHSDSIHISKIAEIIASRTNSRHFHALLQRYPIACTFMSSFPG